MLSAYVWDVFPWSYGFEDLLPYSHRIYDFENNLDSYIYINIAFVFLFFLVFSLEKRVKEIVHKAFWDCLSVQLSEDPPTYDHAIKLVGEIKEVKQRVNRA